MTVSQVFNILPTLHKRQKSEAPLGKPEINQMSAVGPVKVSFIYSIVM